MRRIIAALAAGILFGLGLTLSRMIDPAKVLGFLDVAGNWDPSLALVLAGATGTATLGFGLILGRRPAPLFADTFSLPTARGITLRLFIVGGAIGGLLGMRAAVRVASRKGLLTRIFAGVIFAVAAYMLFRSFAELG